MAESTDKKTRKIAEKRVEPGKEFESYQEAQNQLLAIQAEQQQNLALQANDAMNVQQQNQTLAQAAEVMAMDNLNPATQGILAGYGLNQPRVIKQSNTQRQGPNNITINNTTINNASGPVQGREISIRPQEAGQSKFKAWLTNVFARQDAQWQKQNQEYARRESSLTRNSNKMMRKLEGLGKEIGSAVDPRKQAQRAQNTTMNLLKALGLVYFAKKLPDILGFFNNSEEKIRGWIGEIGDKISGIFNLNKEDGIWYRLYNKDGTGVFNKLLKDIAQWLYERKELADKTIHIPSVFKLGDFFTSLTNWLGVFFGGSKAAFKVLNVKKEYSILEDMNLAKGAHLLTVDDRDGLGHTLNNDKINLRGSGLRGNNIDLNQFSTTVNKDYQSWAKNRGLSNREKKKHKYKEEFLRQYKNIYYKGESDILTYRLHALSSAEQGKSAASNSAPTTLTRHDFNQTGRNLSFESRRATLAASLDIYNMLKWKVEWMGVGSQNNTKYSAPNKKEINIDRIFYLLRLLSDANDVVVFKKFIDLFSFNNNEDAKNTKIKLVIEDMDEYDRRWYWRGSDEGYSYQYLKIVKSKITGDPIELDEKDFKGNPPGAKEWEVISITDKTIQKIINKLTGENEINYTESTRRKALKNLETMGIIGGIAEQNSLRLIERDDNYEETYSDLKRIEAKHKEPKNNIDTPEYTGEEKYSAQASNGTYTSDGNGGLSPLNLSKEEVKNNMDQIRDFLRKEGFTDTQIAGMMGVMSVESWGTFDPRIVELLNGGKRGPGEGIIQWTDSSRKKAFKKWWESKHPNETWEEIPKTSLEDQLGFMMEEFKKRPVYKMIKELPEKYKGDEESILKKTTEWFTMGYVGGSWDGKDEEEKKKSWPKVYNGKTFAESMGQRFPRAAGILNSYFNQPVKKSNITTPNTSPQNPNNTQKDGSGYRPAGTVGFTSELDEYSEVVSPTSVTPSTNFSADYSPDSGSLAMAENITPAERENRSPENNNEILLARCAEGIDYIAKTMAPLSEVINSGNMMVAEAVSKSGGPTNLTPHEPQLEMNQV